MRAGVGLMGRFRRFVYELLVFSSFELSRSWPSEVSLSGWPYSVEKVKRKGSVDELV